jgi:hypothetical protein
MTWGGKPRRRRFYARPRWAARPGNLLKPRNEREARTQELPLPIPRNRGRDALGRLAGWVKPRSEEPAPPVRLGSPRSMELGYTQALQEQHQQQWQRLPGERLFGRLLRKVHRPYRPPPVSRGQYQAEIVGQEESPA